MIEYRAIEPDHYEAVRPFLCEVGWAHRLSDPDLFRQMAEGADRAVVAWEAGRVVGFARALCDDASNGYISTVAVAPDCRKRGIVRELVRRLMGDDPEITWLLRAGRGSEGFWRKMGFAPSTIVMERVRASESAPSV